MIVELSPTSYLALQALVDDALQYPSDATHLLNRVKQELAHAAAAANDTNIDEPSEQAELRQSVGAAR